jgi:hypothetical protein
MKGPIREESDRQPPIEVYPPGASREAEVAEGTPWACFAQPVSHERVLCRGAIEPQSAFCAFRRRVWPGEFGEDLSNSWPEASCTLNLFKDEPAEGRELVSRRKQSSMARYTAHREGIVVVDLARYDARLLLVHGIEALLPRCGLSRACATGGDDVLARQGLRLGRLSG